MDFDQQAPDFDRRAGLPRAARHEIVAAVLSLTRATPDDLCLEIGAGTGQLGRLFAGHVRYLGLDSSYAMLTNFGRKLESRPGSLLLQADAGRRWPIADSCVRVVFGSRVLHLLDPGHVTGESARAAAAGGAWLLIGEVRRDPTGVKARLRQLLHGLLRERGLAPRTRRPARARIIAAGQALGGIPLTPRAVSCWTAPSRAADAIAAWRGKPGLAGMDLPPRLQRDVLAELESRAGSLFGDLEREVPGAESYWLTGVRLA